MLSGLFDFKECMYQFIFSLRNTNVCNHSLARMI